MEEKRQIYNKTLRIDVFLVVCDEKLHHRVESQMKAGDIDWTPRVKTREVVVEHSKQKAEDFG